MKKRINKMKSLTKSIFLTLCILASIVAIGSRAYAQDPAATEASIVDRAASVRVDPSSLTMEVGDKTKLEATVLDADGNEIPAPVIFISRSRRNLGVQATGELEAYRPGEYTIVAIVPQGEDFNPRNANQDGIRAEITVTVPQPALDRIVVTGLPERMYEGTTIRVQADVFDVTDTIRRDLEATLSVVGDNASVDRFGQVRATGTGSFTLTASIESITHEIDVEVVANAISSLELNPTTTEARTGDVIPMRGVAKDASGNAIAGYPIRYAVQAHGVDVNPGAAARAQILDDGRFVSEQPGQYTVMALAGNLSATTTVEISERNVQKSVEVVGRGKVNDRHTSDLWVWEGVDGRDYAITGTWSAAGHAYFWDVTDAGNIKLIDTVNVDARTVNDVKVSEDGRIAVISREGASSRKNGIVILDVSNPAEVKTLSTYDEELTGGVHNVFVYDNHVYALSNGRRYDIINIAEPKLPFRVGRFELDTPGHSIHDVWVEDGIAYSSNWRDGVVMVDVGNGVKGGTPEKPVEIGRYADPQGRNHAAFPFKSQSTGKNFVIMGDEIFPYRDIIGDDDPDRAAGYMHFVDFTDPDNPIEVARYEVPEAGTHNLWVEDDVLYIGYYNGGLRVVDISGDLIGDLYRQGREIAWFMPYDKDSYVRNAPMVWGAQPYKGLVYLADHNSGLWAVRLVSDDDEESGSRQ
jgi:hypothetical protein